MILDFDNNILKFSVNEKDFGIAHDDVDATKKYRMAVTMYPPTTTTDEAACIELVDYQHK